MLHPTYMSNPLPDIYAHSSEPTSHWPVHSPTIPEPLISILQSSNNNNIHTAVHPLPLPKPVIPPLSCLNNNSTSNTANNSKPPSAKYSLGIALIVEAGPDVLETVFPQWAIILSSVNDQGPSTLWTIYPTDESHGYEKEIFHTGLTYDTFSLRRAQRIISQIYHLVDIDANRIPRELLGEYLSAFSPNRCGRPAPLDFDLTTHCHETPNHEWCSACWVFRTLYFLTCTARTCDEGDQDLFRGKVVELPAIIPVLKSQYVMGRGIRSFAELHERIFAFWIVHGKMRTDFEGPVPLVVLPM